VVREGGGTLLRGAALHAIPAKVDAHAGLRWRPLPKGIREHVIQGSDTGTATPIPYGRRISELAAEHPDKTAIAFVPQESDDRLISWRELDLASIRLAYLFAERGVNEDSMVVIGLPNSVEHYFAAHAAWRLGALVLPISYRVPPVERNAILDLAQPVLVVADWGESEFPTVSSDDLRLADTYPEAPLPDKVPNPGKAMGSGGSTGRPKIIVNPGPMAWHPGDVVAALGPITGFAARQTQLIGGPLYHNSPFTWGHFGLFEDHNLVVFERFDAARVVDAIERHHVNFGFFSPTMMQRIALLPDVRERDFSSIQSMFHSAAPCPEWVKRAWFDLVGPEKICEGFGSTENEGTIWIRGDEWLEHPGSVGRPQNCDLRILDAGGRDLPAGEVGEIFMRPLSREPQYYYIGSPAAKQTSDGFTSVGDMGWVDQDGYLFLADRRVDLIISGGANVFPAEVESALSSHPAVLDVAVIGLPDEQWGKRVHAIILPRDRSNPPEIEDLKAYARERLMPYKVPKTYEFVEDFPRDPSGKLRRTKLVEDRA
jgi:bile acid-coenzyme A ligase